MSIRVLIWRARCNVLRIHLTYLHFIPIWARADRKSWNMGGPPKRRNLEDEWMKLSIKFNPTEIWFLNCQLSQLVTALWFIWMQVVTLDTHHCCWVELNFCWRPVRSRERPLVPFFVLLLKKKGCLIKLPTLQYPRCGQLPVLGITKLRP